MVDQGVVPREEQYVNYLCGLGVAGSLWETARSGKLDDMLLEMSYHARCALTKYPRNCPADVVFSVCFPAHVPPPSVR